MNTFLLTLLTTASFAVFGQQFSFQMFFTDAIGNKDTITLGYDIAATDTIDAAFGEINILSIPRDTVFDVRISNEWKKRNANSVSGKYHTKKQITFYDCLNKPYSSIQTIDIYTKNWPVTVTWDNIPFSDSCRNGSVFTSINPGGWWDTGSPSTLARQILRLKDSATFTSNTSSWFNQNYSYIQGSDTIPVFWQIFAPLKFLQTSIAEISIQQTYVKAFPNPFSSQLIFELSDNKQTTVTLYNSLGQQIIKQTFTNHTTVGAKQFTNGIYFYKLSNDQGVIKIGKVLKQ